MSMSVYIETEGEGVVEDVPPRHGGQVDLTAAVTFDLRVLEAILLRAAAEGKRFRISVD